MAKAAKNVSWAPGLKLCQIRLFLSEDAPVLSGSDVQDHLQAKSSRLWHSSMAGSDESLPPGFELFNPLNHFKIDFSQIPLIQWRYPFQFDLNPEWLLVAGEDSVEVHSQNQRQLGVLEAIYPRPSSIPPNPSVSSEAHCHYDDATTPLVPITPIEDEDSDPSNSILPFDATVPQNLPGHVAMPMKYESQQTQGNAMVAQNQSTGTQASVSIHGVEPDVAAAASLAFTAIMTSGCRDSLVDHELLIKILSDPKLVEKLASDHGAPSQGLLPAAAPSSHPTPLPMTSQSPQTHISSPLPISQHGLHHPANFVTTNALNSPIVKACTSKDPNVTSSAHPCSMRDVTYYKSLIEQHGDEKRGTWDPSPSLQFSNRHGDDGEKVIQGLKQRDTKLRVAKPCAYFNTPRGCKHGATCLFLHDASLPPAVERRNPKRVKLDREITGRN